MDMDIILDSKEKFRSAISKCKREKYGAKIYTNVGPQTIQCCTRQEANRVRHVIEKWISMGETNEWRELNSLANLARKRIGIPSDQIISEFKRNNDKSQLPHG